MNAPVLIWHGNSYDLAVPLIQLSGHYTRPFTVYGLVSVAQQNSCFPGIPRMANTRLDFYQTCVGYLEKQYSEKGFSLRIAGSSVEDEFLLLCEEYGIKGAWYTPMHGTEEQQFFDTLLSSLASKAPQLQFRSLYPNMLFTDSELPFAPASLPETFSGFRRMMERKSWSAYAFSDFPHDIENSQTPGRMRLHQYIFDKRFIVNYKQSRNGLGPGDYCSRLSRWIAAGTFSVAEVGSAILHFE